MIYRRFVNEEDLLKEYETDRYYRQFTLGELINQENINAKLNEETGAMKILLIMSLSVLSALTNNCAADISN
jgi:hypothetical protein